jgi:hypothetical protein
VGVGQSLSEAVEHVVELGAEGVSVGDDIEPPLHPHFGQEGSPVLFEAVILSLEFGLDLALFEDELDGLGPDTESAGQKLAY